MAKPLDTRPAVLPYQSVLFSVVEDGPTVELDPERTGLAGASSGYVEIVRQRLPARTVQVTFSELKARHGLTDNNLGKINEQRGLATVYLRMQYGDENTIDYVVEIESALKTVRAYEANWHAQSERNSVFSSPEELLLLMTFSINVYQSSMNLELGDVKRYKHLKYLLLGCFFVHGCLYYYR